ncbi:hypothetical protein [Jannaschia seohaensis]|uniref:Uncharacterized protein n=1 Tax=Jannaschia seohaensis TaxID=475081 RepID=A0A2Y9C7S8_9RHOB|nr:hypothetical protein [Jannaschia seohaensis]PWJ18118.1 hypothetical protein BCF38_105106 [Jannaschia seohaensis]SSA46643.1 hypothetical protein SAMN05421539_105106 [Jannaschia seohaensis]
MKRRVVVWPSESLRAGVKRREFVSEYFDGDRLVTKRNVFFETTSEGAGASLPTADWALLSVLFNAMLYKRDIFIKAPISRQLVHNLDEFQRAFNMWAPQLTVVDIRADQELDIVPKHSTNEAVMTFSGGVDASFAAYRQIFKKPGYRHRDLKVAILAHGFDFSLGKQEPFDVARAAAEQMLEGTGVEVAVVRTNVRTIMKNWELAHGLALAACLHLFSQRYQHGLIAGDEPYTNLQFPWGSTPLTNHLLSNSNFSIETDGSAYTRTTKVMHLSSWKAAVNNVRVCWEGPKTGRNCGKCEKCIRTILNFRACGLSLPSAFPCDVTDEQISLIKVRNNIQRDYLEDILRVARERYGDVRWVQLLNDVIVKYNARVG